jgi:mRNA-degrading endonuclease RelE of RelBE toxin-antitoxin system
MLGRTYDASLPIRLDKSTGASNVSLELGREMFKKLADDPLGTWRLRIGDWRVLFTQHRAGLLITRIVNRRDAY